MTGQDTASRCPWPGQSPLMIAYHDTEWGVPIYDDLKIFEFLVLDSFQAGLSWAIVLNKRENFRQAFAGFDPEKIAGFDEKQFDRLRENAGIIRNKIKIRATISNAELFLATQKEFGTFHDYIWQFVDHHPLVNRWTATSEIPATSRESDAMSKDLKQRGFKFVGSTICYAFMQASGMINDHLVSCFRHPENQRQDD